VADLQTWVENPEKNQSVLNFYLSTLNFSRSFWKAANKNMEHIYLDMK